MKNTVSLGVYGGIFGSIAALAIAFAPVQNANGQQIAEQIQIQDTSQPSSEQSKLIKIAHDVWSVHQLNSAGSCNLSAEHEPDVRELSPTQTLYLIPCSTGFTNSIWRGYISDTGSLYPQVIPVVASVWDPANNKPIETLDLFYPEFDSETKTLTVTERAEKYGNFESTLELNDEGRFVTSRIVCLKPNSSRILYSRVTPGDFRTTKTALK